jgi:hypothetical protein
MPTVKELQTTLKGWGFDPPSGLKKAELEVYLASAQYMLSNRIPLTSIRKEELPITPTERDCRLTLREHLDVHGWAIAPLAVQAEEIRNDFVSWLRMFCPLDSENWTNKQLPYRSKGILQNWIGQTEFMWTS